MTKTKPIWLRGLGALLLLFSLIGSYLLYHVPASLGEEHLLNRLRQMDAAWQHSLLVIFLLGGVLLGAALLFQGGPKAARSVAAEAKSSGRVKIALLLAAVLIPLTILFGFYFWEDRKYYFICLLVMAEAAVPLFLYLEERASAPRRLILLATLCALAVGSRIAFAWLPQCKPMTAIIILCGVSLGAEAGFLVGVLSAFLSNFYFMQGPWTPWQMLAFGLLGLLAGLAFQKGRIPHRPIPIALFGGLSTLLVYGGIMDTNSLLMMVPEPTVSLAVPIYLGGLPFNLIHAAATVVFLLLFSGVMLDSLDRVEKKYGL